MSNENKKYVISSVAKGLCTIGMLMLCTKIGLDFSGLYYSHQAKNDIKMLEENTAYTQEIDLDEFMNSGLSAEDQALAQKAKDSKQKTEDLKIATAALGIPAYATLAGGVTATIISKKQEDRDKED